MYNLIIKDLMTTHLFTVLPTDTVANAVEIMDEQQVSSLPVVLNGELQGLVTESDILIAFNRQDIKLTQVSEIMSSPLLTLSSDDLVSNAYHQMQQHQVRHLPVVDQGEIVGILSESDFRLLINSHLLKDLRHVRRVMRTGVLLRPPSCTFCEAVNDLYLHGASCIIITLGQFPMGIITLRDVIRISRQDQCKTALLGELMSSPVHTINANTRPELALRQLNTLNIRHLVVTDQDKIVGLCELHDLIHLLGESAFSAVKEIQHESATQLKELRKLTSALLETSSDVLVILRENGVIESCNKRASRTFDYSAETHQNKHLWELPKLQNMAPKGTLKSAIANAAHGITVETQISLYEEGTDSLNHSLAISISPIINDQRKIQFLLLEGREISHQRLYEKQLSKNEQHFHQLFLKHQTVELIIDPHTGQIKDANESAERFYGWSVGELCSMKIWDLATLNQQTYLSRYSLEPTTGSETIYLKHRLANGDHCDVELFHGELELAGENLLYLFVYDISARKRAERFQHRQQLLLEQILDRENRLETILDLIIDTIEEYNDHFHSAVLLSKDSELQLAAYTSLNSLQLHWLTNSLSEQESVLFTEILTLKVPTFTEQLIAQNSYWHQPNQPSNISQTLWMFPIPSPNHRTPIGVILIFPKQQTVPSIEEQRMLDTIVHLSSIAINQIKSREAIEQSEQRLQMAIKGSNDGLWDWNLTTDQVYYSPRWKSMLGYDPEELEDSLETWSKLVHPEDRAKTLERVNLCLSGEHNFEAEFRMRHKEGFYIEILSRAAPIYDAQNNPIRLIGTHVDLSEIRSTQRALWQTENILMALFNSAPLGVAFLSDTGHPNSCNQMMQDILGVEEKQLLKNPLFDFNIEPFRKIERQQFLEILEGKINAYSLEKQMQGGSKTALWVNVTVVATYHIDGCFDSAICMMQDITQRKQSDQALQMERAFLQTIIDGIPNPISVSNLSGNPILENRAAKQERFSFTTQLGPEKHSVEGVQESSKKIFQVSNKANETRIIELTTTPLCNPSGEINRVIEISRDITEHHEMLRTLQEKEKKLALLAHHDSLTGLPNRLQLMDRMDHAIQRSNRSGKPFSILFIDLDRFKQINDSFGHETGDNVLIEASARLKHCLRSKDTLARLGGDEFTIILEETQSKHDAMIVAHKLIETLQKPFLYHNQNLFLGGSVGICFYPKDGQDTSTLLRNADSAMYTAKEAGRNTYRCYSRFMTDKVIDLVQRESLLRDALEKEQMRLFYQPQINLHTGEVLSAEALIRWQHPVQGIITPDYFLDLAEETGLIINMGHWVIEQTCRHLSFLQRSHPDFSLAINLSGHQLRHPNLIGYLKEQIKVSGCNPKNLCLEITENAISNNIDQLLPTLLELKKLGIKLSLDDFGTGSTSLRHLKRLPIDELKIDQSFIQNITEDKDDRIITKAVIALGESLGLNIIAEGIEQQAQIELLLKQQCYKGQGFLIGHPSPFEHLLKRLHGETTQ